LYLPSEWSQLGFANFTPDASLNFKIFSFSHFLKATSKADKYEFKNRVRRSVLKILTKQKKNRIRNKLDGGIFFGRDEEFEKRGKG
jgi:hypothetical protein